MYVCICNAVTEEDVHGCMASGACATAKDVRAACGMKPGCGSCTRRLHAMVSEYRTASDLADALTGGALPLAAVPDPAVPDLPVPAPSTADLPAGPPAGFPAAPAAFAPGAPAAADPGFVLRDVPICNARIRDVRVADMRAGQARVDQVRVGEVRVGEVRRGAAPQTAA